MYLCCLAGRLWYGFGVDIQRIIYLVAGTFVLAGLALGYFVNQLWLLLPAFVGFNLFQTAFTGFCPLEKILLKAGVGAKCC
jgi:hypothetical protein